jgi:hypothetical protein
VLSALTCGAAAITKQAGLYVVLWYPILCYAFALKPQQHKHVNSLVVIGAAMLLILSLCLPWYIYIQYLINHGQAVSELSFVTHNIYQASGYSLSLRLIFGCILLGGVFWLCLLLSLIYHYKKISPISILLLMTLIYTSVWLCFYTYATRNLSIITPWLGLSTALACQYNYIRKVMSCLIEKARGYWLSLSLKPLHMVFGFILVGFILSQIPQCSTQALLQSQISQQQSMGDKTLDTMLLRYQVTQGFKGKILTSWDYLGHIPGLSQYYQPYRPISVEANPYQSAWMVNPQELPVVLAKYPSRYILSSNADGSVSEAYKKYFAKLAQQGALKVVLELPDYTLYEINRPIVEAVR